MTPIAQGEKAAMFGGAGVGKTVLVMELSMPWPSAQRASRSLPGSGALARRPRDAARYAPLRGSRTHRAGPRTDERSNSRPASLLQRGDSRPWLERVHEGNSVRVAVVVPIAVSDRARLSLKKRRAAAVFIADPGRLRSPQHPFPVKSGRSRQPPAA